MADHTPRPEVVEAIAAYEGKTIADLSLALRCAEEQVVRIVAPLAKMGIIEFGDPT
jgi:hypothetical protein